jgi:hypothetical protein
MNLNYLDLFLAFLGMTFGLPSVLPGLFFQAEGQAATDVAGDVDRCRPDSPR